MADQGKPAEQSWRAPYLSYETLTNFLDKKLGGNPLPPRIDVHFLDNYAGSVRPLLIATLKTMGLIDEDKEILEPLRIAVMSPEQRKSVLREWAKEFYAEQLALAEQHATAQMLWETFSKRGYNGSTLRRAVIFFLALVEDTGLPNSAHFKAPKGPPSGSRKASGRKSSTAAAAVDGAQPQMEDEPPAGIGGEERFVNLGEAGTVSIRVNVKWLDLPDDTFAKLRRLIKDIESLEATGGQPDDGPAEEAR